MVSSNLTIGVEFDLTASPKAFTVTDLFDYTALLGYADVFGNIKATGPTGVQYHNNISWVTPDIDIASSPDSAALPLPLNSDGDVLPGTHTYIYSVRVVDEVNQIAIISNDVAAKTITVAGDFRPQIATGSVFSVEDGGSTSITPTGVATYNASTNQTTFVIAETLGVLSVNAILQYTYTNNYQKTFTVSFTYEQPEICINITYDQCCTSVTFSDETAYPEGATVTRLHTVRYPLSNPLKANLTSPLQTFISSPAWTGTYTDLFVADIEVESGILTIIDEATNTKEFKVKTTAELCQIATCVEYIANKYNRQLTEQPTAAIETGKQYLNAIGLVTAYNLAIECDNTDDATDFLGKIKEIAVTCGCTDCDCEDCSDGTSVQVVGCCDNVAYTSNTVVLDSPDSSITITSNTVGDTTTFSIIVNQSQLNTFVSTYVATLSINALADVDTATIPPTVGQSLIWNGTNWIPGIPSMSLPDLTDVDPALAPTNLQILRYETASGLWKAYTLAGASVATLTDVTLTGLAANNILKYNGSIWVNVANTYALLSDVNTSGITDGDSFKWDAGTSKFIRYVPVTTLNSLTDVVITGVANSDRIIYDGANWINIAQPTWISTGMTFNAGAGMTNGYAGYADFEFQIDAITGFRTLRGAIDNSGGAQAGPLTLVTLDAAMWPTAGNIPFVCTVGIGGTPSLAFGEISAAAGTVAIHYYIAPATGIVTSGIPAGAIVFGNISY